MNQKTIESIFTITIYAVIAVYLTVIFIYQPL